MHQTALLTQWKWKRTSRSEEGKEALFLICFNKLAFKIVVAVTMSFDSYTFLLPGLGVEYQGASNDSLKTSVRMASKS